MARKPLGKRSDVGQYVPLPYSQLKSEAWRSLSGAAVKLWLELHTRYNGGNNGNLHLSVNEAAKLLRMGKATVQRAYKELVDKGFLALEVPGNWYSRRAHDWRLTTKAVETPKEKVPATMDWRSWKPPKKTKRGSKTEPSGCVMVPLENQIDDIGSAPEPVSANCAHSIGSKMEH